MNPDTIKQDELINRIQKFNFNNKIDSNLNSKIDQQKKDYLQNYVNQEEDNEDSNSEVSGNVSDDVSDNEINEESDSEIEYNNYEDIDILQPQIWTKNVIKKFKEAISIDNGDGIIKVGYGETLTIRVPTHPEGKSIIWEFATDNYDIGFGLFFEFNNDPGNQITIQVSESEDELNYDSDLEKGDSRKNKENKKEYVVTIMPIFRRDSHKEVFCGSHMYPSKGTYLLKFDNTYSLWRSKTLYYRILFSG